MKSTYIGDGIVSTHFLPFSEPKMKRSFIESFHSIPSKYHTLRSIEWRFSILVWAYNQTRSLKGDIIECGVWYGVLSKSLLNYFPKGSRKFLLFDSWGQSGFKMQGPYKNQNYMQDIYDVVESRFKDSSASLVRGILPESLGTIEITDISLLMLDLNSGLLEKTILETLWEKIPARGIIYFDDYGQEFPLVRQSIDQFVYEKDQSLLVFPTGQAVIIKQ